MDVPVGVDARREAATASLRQLRSRLLDLTARNPLVSFPHGRVTGARVHVRAVDGYVDALFAHLGEGKPLNLRSLPAPDDEPEEERQPRFRTALDAARLTDERYMQESAALSGDEVASAKAATVERGLRDRVRASLDMPTRNGAAPTALADLATRLGIDSSFDLRPSPAAPVAAQARATVEFQALALPDVLDRQLAKIRDTARTVAEETGVSTLHLAFGFLEWFESDASDRPITSPLLLLRVDLDRRIARSRYQYSVSAVGDEAEVNLTLSERLGHDFRIKLPALGEEETPEAYLARVRDEVCKGRPRWKVRRFVTLAHFPFARLAMFHDMDEGQWREGLSSHRILASLLAGREAGSSMFAPEHDVDAPVVSAKVPVLVLEADASQHSAVYDVMCGEDLVIEGPPGTGKSQTITNIVAAALASGRRVLFVADKQAALQVVKDRLDKVGLGDFCLELHSGKARKTDVLASLAQRLERRPAPARIDRLDDKLRELAATRGALTRYVTLLNAPFGALGLTVHDVLWADRRRRDGEGPEARQLDEVALPSPDALSSSELDMRRAVLDRFEQAAAPLLAGFGTVEGHPWWGVMRAGLPSVDMEQAVRDTADAATAMEDVAKAVEVLRPFGLGMETTLDELGPIVQALVALRVEEGTPGEWFSGFSTADVRTAAVAWRQACDRYRSAVEAQSGMVALPEGLQPDDAATRLDAAWTAMPPVTLRDEALHALEPLACALRADAAQLVEMEGTVARTVAALGMDAPTNLGEVAVAAAAVTLAAELPQAVMDVMTPELMRRDSAEAVATAAAAIRAARTRRSELDAEYSIPPSSEPALFRRHAAALGGAGLFGFLSPAVKEAKLGFGGLLRAPRKTGRAVMVAALMRVAEHLEAVTAIEADPAARTAFGTAYRGMATDLEAALAAVAWAERVRAAFPHDSHAATTAASTLLSGDPDRLRRIRALAGRPEHRAMLARLGHLPPTAASFAASATELGGQAKAIDAFASLCRDLGIPSHTKMGEVPGIVFRLRASAEAGAGAIAPEKLASALNGTCPPPLADPRPFDAALRLASAVDQAALPQAVRDALWLASPETIRTIVVPAASGTMVALGRAVKRWAALKGRLELDDSRLLGCRIGETTASQVHGQLSAAVAQSGALGGWILYLREREAVEALGLGGLLRLWDRRVLSCPLRLAFDRVFHHALARAAFARHPELDRFTGLGQQEARARFAALDAEAVALRRQRLADELGRYPIPPGIGSGRRGDYTDKSLILLEIGKQKRHIPIRQLLDRAGGAVQAMKPCFMMSPLSVAQYLKPGGLRFDLLVIDEASQMRPEDAVGAIARCGQIVVVGDPKQLPPTAFFARGDGGDDNDDEADEEVDAESILDLAQTVFRPVRRLRWHYRSRHGSLVAFSNREFYDGDLMVFPSPAEADADQGVVSVKVDGIYKARSNQAEVEAVCTAAVEHMRTRPDRSLGIATMNGVQRDLIALEMDRLAATLPEVENYRERWSETLERFFVKNLENVQGDERDVIFISTVFGPPAPGARVLQRFGPINGASGHRRLNVLFTRAKHHVRLFTSMAPEDITAGPDSPRGAQVLKAYLAYAQTGRLEAGVETGREADSDFEVFVRDRLRAAGYDAVPQVGVAGYFIDLAVRDPRSPATFLLGIECDGASYHSSRSARDRDILRQEVLEGLGWTIYRIWSTDWFRDPAGQTSKLLSFIESAIGCAPATVSALLS